MRLEQQSRRLPGHVLALMLAMLAAVLLAGSGGYALRAAGFPSVSGSATRAPATVSVQHAQAPDAQDRNGAATVSVQHAQAPDAQDRNTAVRGTPVYNDQVVPDLPKVDQTWGADEAPQATSSAALAAGRNAASDRLAAECRSASGPFC